MLKIWSCVLVVALACLVAVGSVSAKGHGSKGNKGKTAEGLFQKLAGGKDSISRDDYVNGPAGGNDKVKAGKRFDKMDTNHDGKLTLEEFKAAWQKAQSRKHKGSTENKTQ